MAWHADSWMREGCGTTEGTAAALVATKRLLAYVVSATDRDDEDWMLKLDSAVRHIDETKWLHWTGRVVERICRYHARPGNYERLTRAKVTRVLEKCGMQEEGMHAQIVGHVYAGLAVGLVRVVAAMCNRRPIKVRLPELALDQAANLLARRIKCVPLTGRATGICTRRSR